MLFIYATFLLRTGHGKSTGNCVTGKVLFYVLFTGPCILFSICHYG